MITEEQARLLCEAFGVFELLQDEEETGLLEEHNPSMLDAYIDLYQMAYGEGWS